MTPSKTLAERPTGIGSRYHLILSLLLSLSMLFGVACSESDPLSGDGGSVSLFFTDEPSDEFVAVNMTVTKIDLIGGRGGTVISTMTRSSSKRAGTLSSVTRSLTGNEHGIGSVAHGKLCATNTPDASNVPSLSKSHS